MDAESLIKGYIGPRKKVNFKFLLGLVLTCAAVTAFIFGGKIMNIDSPADAAPLAMLVVGIFILAGNAPDVFEAKRNGKRSLRLLEECGETARAAMELGSAEDKGLHYIFTEHYVFGEGTGAAVRLSDIKEYTYEKANWSRAPGSTYGGVMVRTFSGKWFTIAGPSVNYSEYEKIYRLLDEAVKRNEASGMNA